MLAPILLALSPVPQDLTRPSEAEIRRGWLLEHQDADGRWDADGFTKHDSPAKDDAEPGLGEPQDDVLATSLALWACLGDGRGLREGVDADDIARGVRWLLSKQELDTGLVRDESHEHEVRHHAIATVVLCDFQYYENAPLLRDACARALAALVKTQASDGSWGDTRTTAWALLAFEAARAAELEVDEDSVRTGHDYQRAMVDERDLLLDPKGEFDAVATNLAILVELCGSPAPDRLRELSASAEHALERLTDPDAPPDGEFWFTAAAANLRLGGETWESLQDALKREVLQKQELDGPLHGSWDPRGAPGGRVVETAWGALTLEVYFRYCGLFPSR